MKKVLIITRNLFISLIIFILLILFVRTIGIVLNKKIPKGGINEEMYVEINNSKQWISIYSMNKDNPILLYLHGGPGSSSSEYDFPSIRKWSKNYTVVNWDQRNCGKSYDKTKNDTVLTYDIMLNDGIEITKFLLNKFNVSKIILLGHSWGTFLGSHLVLKHPEYYSCLISAGQLVNVYDNEVAFMKEALIWTKDDKEGKTILSKMSLDNLDEEYFLNKNLIMNRYGYGYFSNKPDYSLILTVFFNPYYSIFDYIKVNNINKEQYNNFTFSKEFEKFNLDKELEYKVPIYYIVGDKDYQTNYKIAIEYFNKLNCPKKELFIMKECTHSLFESKSNEFKDLINIIAEKEN